MEGHRPAFSERLKVMRFVTYSVNPITEIKRNNLLKLSFYNQYCFINV